MSEGTMQVKVQWLEGKRIAVSARGNRLIVDEIYADGRQGMGFRPTELLLGALGACTMGTLLTFCKNMNIPVESFVIDVEGKRETSPERVSDIHICLRLGGDIPENRLETLRRVAGGCRIHHTLRHSPSIGIELEVGERTV